MVTNDLIDLFSSPSNDSINKPIFARPLSSPAFLIASFLFRVFVVPHISLARCPITPEMQPFCPNLRWQCVAGAGQDFICSRFVFRGLRVIDISVGKSKSKLIDIMMRDVDERGG